MVSLKKMIVVGLIITSINLIINHNPTNIFEGKNASKRIIHDITAHHAD